MDQRTEDLVIDRARQAYRATYKPRPWWRRALDAITRH
jgi:hypothetical protein